MPFRFRNQISQTFAVIAGVFFCHLAGAQSSSTKPVAGLCVTYASSGQTDVTTAPNIWLYVPAGKPPTPFLPGEKFTATWAGFLSVDLRGDYAFQAELNGSLKLEINGTNVLDATGTNSISDLTKLIRLTKGTNALRAIFTSPAQGDAFIRLSWKPKDSFLQPIPSAALSHSTGAEEQTGIQLRLGRELFVDHRCAKCHVAPKLETAIPELDMDAPSFEDIGSRRNVQWMARWIADPKNLRASAHMPKVFGGDAKSAEAIAAFLGSLNKNSYPAPDKGPMESESDAGKKLFETLHCVACHNAPDTAQMDANKISLKQVRAKFAANVLVEFLKQPDAHYAWIPMPRFKLSDSQRGELAAYLILNSEKVAAISQSSDAAVIESGKKLVQNSGCLNCHSLKLENQFSTKTLAQISNWKAGCLAEKPEQKFKAPQFGFSVEQRDALQKFAATDRASLSRHVPTEFAERQSRSLNCIECHGKIENVPQFEILGGKLKPEWTARFIAGEISYKPRPWLESQMPAFPKRAQLLAEGLAMQHGFPPNTCAEPAIEKDAAEIGQKLVSVPPLGFSCVTCHSVGSAGATQVFEAPGINLAYSGERLQPAFFKRWLLAPSRIDPVSKMPTYFDEEGKSPLTEVYEGDGEKQINAVWHYLRLGDKMSAPKTE